jgi:hypothetical protein
MLYAPLTSPHARHMPRPSHPPCFDHPNNTGRRVQTMQLLIMQLSPTVLGKVSVHIFIALNYRAIQEVLARNILLLR